MSHRKRVLERFLLVRSIVALYGRLCSPILVCPWGASAGTGGTLFSAVEDHSFACVRTSKASAAIGREQSAVATQYLDAPCDHDCSHTVVGMSVGFRTLLVH